MDSKIILRSFNVRYPMVDITALRKGVEPMIDVQVLNGVAHEITRHRIGLLEGDSVDALFELLSSLDQRGRNDYFAAVSEHREKTIGDLTGLSAALMKQ